MADRCPKRVSPPRTPDGMTVEQIASHPTYRYALDPQAQCELDSGHGQNAHPHDLARRHRNGGLTWWDPPIVEVR